MGNVWFSGQRHPPRPDPEESLELWQERALYKEACAWYLLKTLDLLRSGTYTFPNGDEWMLDELREFEADFGPVEAMFEEDEG